MIKGLPIAITVGVAVLNAIIKLWIMNAIEIIRPSSNSLKIS